MKDISSLRFLRKSGKITSKVLADGGAGVWLARCERNTPQMQTRLVHGEMTRVGEATHRKYYNAPTIWDRN